MSSGTPYNPYGTTSTPTPGVNASPASGIGGLTKVIFVLFLVFGIIGVFGGCIGLLNLIVTKVVQTSSLQVDDGMGPGVGESESASDSEDGPMDASGNLVDEPATPPASAFDQDQKAMMEALSKDPFPGATIVQVVLIAVSTAVSSFMVVGGIFGLQGKKLGLSITRNVSAFMSLFKIPETAIGAYIGFKMQEAIMAQAMSGFPKGPQGPNIEEAKAFVSIFVYIMLGVGIGYGILMMAMYLFVYLHTSKESVRANFR